MFVVLDTEFNDLVRVPRLISLGLAAESGSVFYAELPPSSYEGHCSDFVLEHVIPHLQGGKHVLDRLQIQQQLCSWLSDLGPDLVLVTDSPDYDFELVKPFLLPRWPSNLADKPLAFDDWSCGSDRQAELEQVRMKWYDADRPEHHALQDAQASRAALLYAVATGFRF